MPSTNSSADPAVLRDQLRRAIETAEGRTHAGIDAMRHSLLSAALALLDAPDGDPAFAARVATHALTEWYQRSS